MSKQEPLKSNGLGVVLTVTIVLTTLKLAGHLDWSWLQVLAPLWIAVIILSLILIVAVLVTEIAAWWRER